MNKTVLAVDFGTSNSYLCKCPADDLVPSPVDLCGNKTGIETAVLYRPNRLPLIGEAAFNAWEEMDAQERSGCSLRSRFKPEIARDKSAYQCGRDFFAAILDLARKKNIDIAPDSRDVYFGMPCESSDSYRSALRLMAREAGFGEIKLLEEPLAAMLAHVACKDLAPSETLERVLVLDFGGGTCDLALLDGLDIVRAWGDWHLGGRVFDDLFFQWFLDSNPGLEKKLKNECAEGIVHWYWCRESKESFSETMARDRNELWHGSVPGYGVFHNLSWEKFLALAGNYRSSKEMREIDPQCPGSDGPEDLLRRLGGLLKDAHGAKTVILAGGSSQWPFVEDLLKECLPGARLVRSDQPYAVVARGLSMLPALHYRSAAAMAKLTADRDHFLNKFCREQMEPLLHLIADDVGAVVADLVVKNVLVPRFQAFEASGGSIDDLTTTIATAVKAHQDRIEMVFRDRVNKGMKTLVETLSSLTKKWFQEHGVRSLPPSLMSGLKGVNLEMDVLPKAYESELKILDSVIGLAVSSVVASICGGTGMALIWAGLPGLVIGGGLAAAGYLFGHRWLMEKVQGVRLPAFIISHMTKLSNRQITSIREKVRKQVSELVQQQWNECRPAMTLAVSRSVDREIAALSMLNQLGE